ncbi:MAG: 2-hydroxychromene-2-carboxylate isomerase, partial [Octadecabacter sp.]
MPHIDYYFATISPFTYLAGPEFEDLVKKHGATVTYKPLDIMALFARTGGTPPGQRHVNRQEYRLQDMRRRAIVSGLPMSDKPAFFPTNMAPSSYAIIAAQNAGGNVGALVNALT